MSPQRTVLYALGGADNSSDKSISRYDPETDSWNYTPPEMPFKRTGFGCVSINNDIFVISGTNGWLHTNTVFKLNTEKGKWLELPQMKRRRAGCGAACSADGKYIYVAGGWNRGKSCSSVERYSIEDWKWTIIKPMSAAKVNLQLVELGGYIYALGGFDQHFGHDNYNDWKGVAEAERYNPETDQWSPIAPMKHDYMHGLYGAAVLDGKIYVLGESGFEMYSPEEDRWTELPAPAFSPRFRRLVALNGELLAVGGMVWNGPVRNCETAERINVVECYDVEKQIWSRKPDMDIGRARPGIAVIKEFIN